MPQTKKDLRKQKIKQQGGPKEDPAKAEKKKVITSACTQCQVQNFLREPFCLFSFYYSLFCYLSKLTSFLSSSPFE
jgi:hypothetical protein